MGGKQTVREPKTYRDHLEQIRERLGDKAVLAKKDVLAYTGRGQYWVDHHIKLTDGSVTAVSLARQLALMDGAGND